MYLKLEKKNIIFVIMLSKLLIKNLVVIDTLEIDFSNDWNIIVGSSGAGKSLIATAIMFLFGGKIVTDYIRDGSSKAIVEGTFIFDLDAKIFNLLSDLDIVFDTNEIVIRREINMRGSSRCFINDNPVTISVLKSFCRNIFDFHSQNAEHLIREKAEQLKIIDCLLDDISILDNYKITEEKLKHLTSEYNLLLSKKNNLVERSEVLNKLVNEIIEINPQISEDSKIKLELTILENSEELILTINNLLDILDNNKSTSVINNLNEAAKDLSKLSQIDNNTFLQYQTEFNTAIITIKETQHFINKYKDNIDFSEECIEKLRNRFVDLKKITKRYGSIEEALNKKNEYQNELQTLENFDQNIDELSNQIASLKKELFHIANKLTEERTKTAKTFADKLINELTKLGLENTNIEFNFNPKEINDIEFLISMNRGESVGLLGEIASGGEISRIMLAIRTILATKDNTPILIFDEIDVGMSGKIAQRVGKCMQSLSKYHQVITITHLPQVAAMGDNIIAVEKHEINNRTLVTANTLDSKDKVVEIAKMLSGETITDVAIETAKVLIKEGK